jgi:hypothetical protein
LRVADVLRAHGPAYLERYGRRVVVAQRRVLADLTACRTPAMGSYADQCTYCGSSFFGGYNSCRNRHCPTCGGPTRARWLQRVRQAILPVPHFHLIFTLPHSLSTMILANRRPLYNLMFTAAWKTIQTLVADSKRFGGQTGAVMVLHTWDQRLGHHPHIHAVVPGGALSPDGRWRASAPDYFLPVELLSALFREYFLHGLTQLRDAGKLQLKDKLAPLADRRKFRGWLFVRTYDKDWVVHVQPAPSGCDDPEAVLKYLARYIAGTAISDQRLISHDGQRVRFWVKDRKRKRRHPVELDGLDFTCRFMMHVLPKGFQRARYRGLFHNSKRKTVLPQIRQQLAEQAAADTAGGQQAERSAAEAVADVRAEPPTCPACGVGQLKRIRSRDTPDDWMQVLWRSPFRPPWGKWNDLDLRDWTPVLVDDPPTLPYLRQLDLPLIYYHPLADDTQAVERCRGQPTGESSCQRAA